MNSMHSFFSRFCQYPLPRRAAVMLFALAWSSLTFGGEIHDAAKKGDLEKVEALLKDNANLVCSKDNHGRTPLHCAVGTRHKDVVELLLASRAEVNAKGTNGGTPLHMAAVGGFKEVVELLLVNEAEVNAKNIHGKTPLHYAALNGHKAVMELLLAHGAEFNVHDAAAGGDLEKVKALLKDNPDLVSSKDTNGWTPLHWAAAIDHNDVAELLLANKAEVNATDTDGETPLHMVVAAEHKDVAELLRQHGGHE